MRKLLAHISAVLAPDTEQVSEDVRQQLHRDTTWPEREILQHLENERRRAAFDAKRDCLKVTGLPHWMGPPARTLLQRHADQALARVREDADAIDAAMREIGVAVQRRADSRVHTLHPRTKAVAQ